MNLSDEETILTIQENPYMQYMLGLSEFTDNPVFHPSLFVTIRTRLQIADLNDFTSSLLSSASKSKRTEHPSDDCNDVSEDDVHTDSQGRLHKGSMKVDATCSDAEVRFPTDVDLLEDGSRVINRYIDKLCDSFSLVHPVAFRKKSRMAYLEFIKMKKKSKKRINSCKSLLLTYLTRDIRTFVNLIAVNGTHLLDALKRHEKKTMRSIITMFHQQESMFKEGTHRIADRIVSIFQPHIRPIVFKTFPVTNLHTSHPKTIFACICSPIISVIPPFNVDEQQNNIVERQNHTDDLEMYAFLCIFVSRERQVFI